MTDKNFTPVNLDSDLDDIDDLPSFTTFPTGAYTVTLSKWEMKEINDNPNFLGVTLVMDEVHEVTETLEAGEEAPKAGDIQDVIFDMGNEFGAGKLKEFLKPLKAKFGTSKIGATLEAASGAKLLLVQKRTPSKKDPEKKFPQIKSVAVL